MVNEPFKKVNKSSMDLFISDALANKSTINENANNELEDNIQI